MNHHCHSPDLHTEGLSQRRRFLQAGLGLMGLGAGLPSLAQAQSVSDPAPGLNPAEMERRAGPLPAVGSRLVLPRLNLIDGSVFAGGATLPRTTVVYWWASTCPFCAVQSPEMDKLWRAQRQHLDLIGLSVDKSPQEAQQYLARKGYAFPSAWVSAAVQKALPKPRGLPITLVLARDGRVLQAEKGQLFPEDVAQIADLA